MSDHKKITCFLQIKQIEHDQLSKLPMTLNSALYHSVSCATRVRDG